MLDSEMRERAEAAGMDVAELDRQCVGYDGVIDVLRQIATVEMENAVKVAPVPADADPGLGVGRGRWRRQPGPSIVLSIRFDHDEYEDLRLRAESKGMGTSVLARSYVRNGLGASAVRLLD